MALPAHLRTAVRAVHDERDLIMETDDGWRLSGPGSIAYQQIMASGDGPEDLKEMFRF